MSLRKSPRLTPRLLEASRRNAQHSTGARTPAGKQNSKFNAVKHGERSDPENHHEVMRALGEDPAQFEALRQGLRRSFGPADDLLEKQVDDLAHLYWRRQRLGRAQEGVMRRTLLALEEAQHRRRLEIEGVTFHAGQAINIEMSLPADPAARLRLLLSYLGVIRVQVRARSFLAWQASALQGFYGKKGGWRAARLRHLLSLFAEDGGTPLVGAEDVGASLVGAQAEEEGGHQGPPCDAPAASEPAGELQYQELLRLLEEEMAGVQEEFEYEEKLNEAKAAIERDACLAPEGEQWKMMLRREETLDRSIDRKLKLLLSLRKDSERSSAAELCSSEDVGASGETVGAPRVGARAAEEGGHEGRSYEEAETRDQKIDERSGNVLENKGRLRKGTGACRQATHGRAKDLAGKAPAPVPQIWELQ